MNLLQLEVTEVAHGPRLRGGERSAVQVMGVLERLDPFREEEEAAAV